MRQRSSPLSDSSPAQVLHPVLQAALDSLDVELEEELTRYRRQRHRQARHGKHIPVPAWQPHAQEQPGASRSPQLPLMSPSSQVMEAMVHPELSNVELPVESSPRSEQAVASLAAASPVSAHSVAFGADHLSGNPSGMTPFLSKYPEMAADKTLDRLRELAIAANHPEWTDQAWTEQESGNTAEAENPYAEEPTRSGFSDFSESPNDYLESTEELLQSIAEESPDLRVERESSLLNSLLTPLGIGSMVLLLLSSATLGYVIMHPSSLDLLNPPENTTRDGKAASAASATPFASPLIPDSPNLAAEEFVDLNVDNLSTIPGTSSSKAGAGSAALGSQGRSLPTTPQTSPFPDSNPQQSPSGSSRNVENAPEPEAVAPTEVEAAPPAPEPEATVSEPESTPETAAPEAAAPPTLPAIDPPTPASETASPDVATATAATGAPNGTYYVVTPYNGDPSLEQARQAVPQAYVRNFETGASVQLGVFSSAENAQELVQELEAKGIAAEVYQP